jgi:hypothetical protein
MTFVSGGSARRRNAIQLLLAGGFGLILVGCGSSSGPGKTGASVTTNGANSIVLKTAAAEFDLLPNGYLQAYLLKDGSRLSLDEPQSGPAGAGDYLVSGGKEIRDFTLDLAHANVKDASGKLGHGKRIEVAGHSSAGIEKTLAVEVYDDFPSVAITTLAYRNTGSGDFKLDQVVAEQHRLNATLADPKAAPSNLWSFQGSAYDWGKDEILPISQGFTRPNLVGGPGAARLGGGVPVLDF